MSEQPGPAIDGCPFCGGPAKLVSEENQPFFVRCDQCNATGPHEEEPRYAVMRWNGGFVT